MRHGISMPRQQKTEDKKEDHSDNNTLYLVDGSGFIFRAYHAIPPLTRPDGTPVNAVYGFTAMMVKLLTDFHAPYIAVIFDAARKNFRNDIYEDYKANRTEPPEDLIPQFPMFRTATEAFEIPCLELEGYEADDLIATYARLAKQEGKDVVIVGSDKDLMQLVDDHVRLYDPIKQKFIGPAEVEEKFGVPPHKVIDVQALAGDSIDNIPGVPGIGVKTAAQLINEYESLENLLDNLESVKQNKRRETLKENRDNAIISKKLVTLDTHVDVSVSLSGMKTRNPDTPKLAAFLQEQGFKTIYARLRKTVDMPDVQPDSANENSKDKGVTWIEERLPSIENNVYTLITDTQTLKQWMQKADEKGILAVDTETTSLTPAKAGLVGISIAIEPGEAAYIPLGHTKPDQDLLTGDDSPDIEQIPLDEALSIVKPVLEDPGILKIMHNAKYDWQMLAAAGIEVSPVDDTILLSYVLDGTRHGHGMDELSALFLDHTPIRYTDIVGKGKSQITFDKVPPHQALDYAAEDAEITLRFHNIFKPRLAQEQCASVYENCERPLIPVIARMELTGIKIDTGILQDLSRDFARRLGLLEEEIHDMAGHSFNVGSPKQIGSVLFDEMGLQGGKRTKTGDWSTTASLLEDLAAQGHDIVQKILDWRQLAKLKSTYTDALQNEINPKTGRVHTSYHMALTNTGRLSSSDPNLQNIPIRSEDGRKIRTAFVAEEGWTLLSADYSQVELRLAAELAGVKALQQAFRDGVDIHTHTAAKVFAIPEEEVTPELRRQAKAINFGIIYGISAYGLASQLGCSQGEASSFIKQYLTNFSEIQDYMQQKKEEARSFGYVRTLYGRKCVISGINDKNMAKRNFAERQAINAPLQGTAADIMKRAMIKIPPVLEKENLRARMLLQVHDELIFEVPDDELDATREAVIKTMQDVSRLSVPLIAEAGHGKNWGEAH